MEDTEKPAVARVKTMNIRKIVIKLENGIDQQEGMNFMQVLESLDHSDN